MIHSGEPIANPAMTLQTFVRLFKKFHSVFFLDQIYPFAYSYSILLPEVTACLDLGRVAGRENGL